MIDWKERRDVDVDGGWCLEGWCLKGWCRRIMLRRYCYFRATVMPDTAKDYYYDSNVVHVQESTTFWPYLKYIVFKVLLLEDDAWVTFMLTYFSTSMVCLCLFYFHTSVVRKTRETVIQESHARILSINERERDWERKQKKEREDSDKTRAELVSGLQRHF